MIGVLNTRPRSQAQELSGLLRRAGYLPFEVPLVELTLIPEGLEALRKFSDGEYDGILLSSPNLLSLLNIGAATSLLPALCTKPWYLVSARARPQVEALGARVAFAPRDASLHGFLREFPRQTGLRLLHPCSRATRLDPEEFSRRGISIHNLAVYSPRLPADAVSALRTAWPNVQAVLFASGSAVRNLFSADSALAAALGSPEGPLAVSIGPSASEALGACGVKNITQAKTADNEGLIATLNLVFPERLEEIR